MKLPAAVMAHLNSPAADAPRPDDPRFARNEVHLIASAAVSLEAAAAEAERQGIEAVILSDSIEGEARDVGAVHAAIAREVAMRDRPFAKPVLILSGGETTVTLRAKGKGGRNSEFLLAFALGDRRCRRRPRAGRRYRRHRRVGRQCRRLCRRHVCRADACGRRRRQGQARRQ